MEAYRRNTSSSRIIYTINMSSITPLLPENAFLLRADRTNESHHTFANGLKIFIDGEFAPYSQATQIAEIAYCPPKITKWRILVGDDGRDYESGYHNQIPLNESDKVYVHHFVINDENAVELNGEILYRCSYNDIYATEKDGIVYPREKWIFTKPIRETEESIQKEVSGIILLTKAATGIIPLRAKVVYISQLAEEEGINVGDIIIYRPDSDYEMTICGDTLYRQHLDDVFGIVDVCE